MLCRVVRQTLTDVSEVRTAIHHRGDDDRGSKYLCNVGQPLPTTRRNIPEDNHLHTCRRENLKSHNIKYASWNKLKDENKLRIDKDVKVAVSYLKSASAFA
jgi:hypothetical protein